MLEQIGLTNFKAFARQELPLAPFTLLTGLNSSGKSTVLQALSLLRQSFDSGELGHGLLLNEELVQLGTGRDVRHEAYQEDDPHITLAVRGDGCAVSWTAAYEPEADHLPLVGPAGDPGRLPTLFGPGFQYLRADRIAPEVSYPRSHHAVVTREFLGPHGEHTVNFLRAHQERHVAMDGLVHPGESSRKLLDQTAAWLRKLCPGVQVDAEGIAGTDTVRLSYTFGSGASASNPHRPTNVGFGLTYALPVVVACLSARPGSLVLLENPEAHLHPRGQTWLAYLACAAAAGGAQIVMETHSDHVLNGMRLCVKERRIPGASTAVHYFRRDGMVTEVLSPAVGDDGMLSDWPEGFFDEWENALDQLLD
ncbi:AAA family ATPase [Streptomyces aidingensis]|uniref:Predicted ATPase n=1 Tax=Streptomyces aidingensis TaxID=910347 RepID=A0A1I1TKD8_9ACTN|nr:DUF3696 domain-containing protein [Streptomyces aidingensis]SFD59102.1 Predicted ATPase [Streptomyces aidingensis]